MIDRLDIHNTNPVYGGFGVSFIHNTAQMEWNGQVGDYSFVSARMSESSSVFAQLVMNKTGHSLTSRSR